MHKPWLLLIFLLISAQEIPALSDELNPITYPCLEENLALDITQFYNFQSSEEIKLTLPSTNSQGSFFTAASYHFQSDPLNSSAKNYFSFVLPNQVSLPYNIYQIELAVGEEENNDIIYFQHDFTANCTEAGRSIFPGQELHLPEIKITPHNNGAPREIDKLKIRIWGHL